MAEDEDDGSKSVTKSMNALAQLIADDAIKADVPIAEKRRILGELTSMQSALNKKTRIEETKNPKKSAFDLLKDQAKGKSSQ